MIIQVRINTKVRHKSDLKAMLIRIRQKRKTRLLEWSGGVSERVGRRRRKRRAGASERRVDCASRISVRVCARHKQKRLRSTETSRCTQQRRRRSRRRARQLGPRSCGGTCRGSRHLQVEQTRDPETSASVAAITCSCRAGHCSRADNGRG